VTESVALSTPRLVQKIDTEVRAGDVAFALARPVSYPLYHLAGYRCETALRLPVNVLVGSLVALLAVGRRRSALSLSCPRCSQVRWRSR
jgi:ABC-2 type transport system permease protein